MLVGRGGFYREGDLQLLLEFYFLLLPAAFTPRLSLNCVEDLFEINSPSSSILSMSAGKTRNLLTARDSPYY
jgi:hypothetical protein